MIKKLSIMALCALSSTALAGDLVVVRHGNSDHNANYEYNSNPNHENYKVSCLTDLGIAQAEATAQKLAESGYANSNIEKVYVSPLPRTRQTAKILSESGLFSADKITYDTRLIEVRAGDREGLSTEIFDGDHWERHDAYVYNGETNAQVRERVVTLYNDTVMNVSDAAHPETHVLYVTHGMPSYELIDLLEEQRIRLETAGTYVLPLKKLDA